MQKNQRNIAGVKRLVNRSVRLYLKYRYQRLMNVVSNAAMVQNDWLLKLLSSASDTEIGRRYDFDSISDIREFQSRLPIQTYPDIQASVHRMMMGERDILWPGRVKWYAKSSGTTSGRHKFIPVSRQNLRDNHIAGSWDSVSIYYHHKPEARIFEQQNLIIGGTINSFRPHPSTQYGDVSAILIHKMPAIGRPFYYPDFETASMKNWDAKLNQIATMAKGADDIASISGVPTWNIVLFRKILEQTGKSNMLEVWPEAELYMHGGVNFEPYQDQFRRMFPSDTFAYQEIYNASEGYFATQDDYRRNDMLLLPDNGTFYEFIPLQDYHSSTFDAVLLPEIELLRPYVLVLSTNSGLWRYVPGDVVHFTDNAPYRIQIIGRTQSFINVFGEEVIVANTDEAITKTAREFKVCVNDYTVAPIHLDQRRKGGHQWLIEFDYPVDTDRFEKRLDVHLRSINADYDAKRYNDLALDNLTITPLIKGSFENWLKHKKRIGAQAKIPRLNNNRLVIEDILEYINRSNVS